MGSDEPDLTWTRLEDIGVAGGANLSRVGKAGHDDRAAPACRIVFREIDRQLLSVGHASGR